MADNVVPNNKQKSKVCVSQMQKYGALIVALTAKTHVEYKEYLEGIQYRSHILKGYKRRHILDKQASNLLYALAASKEATRTSNSGYENCMQASFTKERVYRRAVKKSTSETSTTFPLRDIPSILVSQRDTYTSMYCKSLYG